MYFSKTTDTMHNAQTLETPERKHYWAKSEMLTVRRYWSWHRRSDSVGGDCLHGDRCNSICAGNRSVHMELNMTRQHLVCRAEIVGLFQSLWVSKTTRLKIIRNTVH